MREDQICHRAALLEKENSALRAQVMVVMMMIVMMMMMVMVMVMLMMAITCFEVGRPRRGGGPTAACIHKPTWLRSS